MKKVFLLLIAMLSLTGCDKTFYSDSSKSDDNSSVVENSSSSEENSSFNTSSNFSSSSSSKESNSINNLNPYYKSIDFTKTGSQLKTQLSTLINNHTNIGYNALWEAFKTTDKRDDGKVWDMYSSESYDFVKNKDNGSGGNAEGQYYNREHSVPNSYFGGVKNSPMYADLFHLYPTDKYVNNRRSNYPYGETNGGTYKSKNGSKLGTSTFQGYSGTVFEPIDEYKGDFARSYFYFVTCYENENITQTNDAKVVFVKENNKNTFTTYAKNLFLKWAKNDPVSKKETDRNEAVYALQKNRNPFIDIPGLENSIF